jgi:PAS domain S-box-containing protein
VYANDVALRQHQKTRGELLGSSIWDVFPDLVGTAFETQLRRVMSERLPAAFDFSYPALEAWFENRVYPLEEGIMVIAADVTARRRTERELRETLNGLEAHLVNTPLAVIEFDSSFRITRWAGKAERMFGWKRDEVLGKAIAELRWIHEEDVPRLDGVCAALARGEMVISENRNYDKAGAVHHCTWYNSAVLGPAGQLDSVLSLILDVTEQKQADREIQRLNASLRERVKEIETIINTVTVGIGVASDPECRSIWVNPALARMLRVPTGDNASNAIGCGFGTGSPRPRGRNPVS